MANGQTLGAGAFTKTPPPKPSSGELEDQKRFLQEAKDMARRAGDAFQVFKFQMDDLKRAGNTDPRTWKLLLNEMLKTGGVWVDALEEATLPTFPARKAMAAAEDSVPKAPVTFTTIKDDERRLREQGGVSQVAVPAVRSLKPGEVQIRGGKVEARVPPAPRNADTQIVQARDPDGNIVNVLVSKVTGKIINEFGRGPELRFEPPTVPGVGREELAKLDEAEIGATNAIQGAFKLRQAVLEGGPEVLGAPGVLSGLAQGFVSQTLGFAQLIGVDIDSFESGASADDAESKADTIFARIDKAGTINAEIRSAIVNLAFAAAAASGQTGRGVSDRDYERFVRELGAGASKPEVFASVLTKFAERLNDNFATRFKVKMRRIPGRGQEAAPNLFKEIFGASGVSAAPAGDQSRRASSLSEGTTATNSASGEKLIVRGGKWVKQ